MTLSKGGRERVKKLAKNFKIRLATWNIRSLTDKTMELADVMSRREITIACFQETKWVGEKVREIENSGHKFYYTEKDRQKNGVGIIVFKHLKDYVTAVKGIVEQILLIKLVVQDSIINVISAYTLQMVCMIILKSNFGII